MMTNLNIYRNLVFSALTTVILTAGTLGFASQDAVQEGDDLNIAFAQPKTLSSTAGSTLLAQEPNPLSILKSRIPATALVGVNPEVSENEAVIRVEADGALENFKSFTITEAPPRIVLDFPGIQSPYKAEQRLAFKTGPVSRVRHFAHPEKVRVVVETQKRYLASYTSEVVDTGIIIHVGNAAAESKSKDRQLIASLAVLPPPKEIAESAEKKSAPEQTLLPALIEENKDLKLAEGPPQKPPHQSFKPISSKGEFPAAVDRVEFAAETDGSSSVIILTTRPVVYDVKNAGEKQVLLKLLNTKVPEQHKRAIITTRFESAVDRITPRQAKNDSLVAVELRENVPYTAEQTDNRIRLKFDAATVPPKPYESAEPPAWKTAKASSATALLNNSASSSTVAQQPSMKISGESLNTTKGTVVEQRSDRDYGQDFDMGRQKIKDSYNDREKDVTYYQEQKTKLYTGEKVSLDFFETDIKNVFRILKEVSGRNFAIDKEVSGKVTLSLEKPLPWDQVLDLILKMNQLGKTTEGDVIRISTLATLQKEETELDKKRKAYYEARLRESHITAFFTLSYADADEVFKNAIFPLYSAGRAENVYGVRADASIREYNQEFSGTVSVDKPRNMIIVTDTPAAVKRIKEIIQKLDVVTPQVVIEARIVEANSTFTREIGFDWGTISLEAFKIGGAVKLGPTTMQANNIPSTFSNNNTMGFNFSTLEGINFSIVNAKLSASEVEGKTNIVSSPKIFTVNGQKATIKQGLEVPYLERDSSGNATVRFKNVDLLLEVTPSVSDDNRVSMNIFITKNDVVDPTAPEPALSTNEARTKILVDDGDTIVIGGILKDSKKLSENGIPGLRKLPGFGWLFRSEKLENSKNELLIFITPRVVKLEQRKTEHKLL